MSWFDVLKRVPRSKLEPFRNMDRNTLLAEQKKYKDSGKHEEYLINAMVNGYDFDNAIRIAYDIIGAMGFGGKDVQRFDRIREPVTPMTHVRMLRRKPA
tara:strand:- start:615 stop:911 length:297 start_codon:yes stop_codon:yes gene_type:complete